MDHTGYAIIGLIFTLIHELGHIFCISAILKKPIKNIHLGISNIDIYQCECCCDLKFFQNIVIMISGSFLNFVAFFTLIVMYNLTKKVCLYHAGLQSFAIGLFNMLPISSLDGGKILKLYLDRKLDICKSNFICKLVSIIFLIPVFFLSVYLLTRSRYNFSLLIIAIYLVYEAIMSKKFI